MVVGLRIFNNDGITQISDWHHNMALVGKGTATTADDGNQIGGVKGIHGKKINFVSDTPVIFAASAPSGATTVYTGKSGNVWTCSILFGNVSETATWYAFSYPKNISSGLGLRVFNEDGSLVYDAGQKPIRIAHFSAINIPNVPLPSNNHHHYPQYPATPPDIYVSQPKNNRTYASLSINMLPYRVLQKYWLGGWLLGWGLCYYMPVVHADGIRLVAKHVAFTPSHLPWPYGAMPYGGAKLYSGMQLKQISWIIDVTGY